MPNASSAMQMSMRSQPNEIPTIQHLLARWDSFMKMEKNQQRNILGEVIYPFVMRINEKYAPKITGMLIDLEHDQIKQCLTNESFLVSKINDAGAMLLQQD